MSKENSSGLFFTLLFFLSFIVGAVLLPKVLEPKTEEISYSRILNLINENKIEMIELETSYENDSTATATGSDGTIYSVDIPNTEIFIEYVQSKILLYGNMELTAKDNSGFTFGDIFGLFLTLVLLILPISMILGIIKGFMTAKKGNPPSFMSLGLESMSTSTIEVT